MGDEFPADLAERYTPVRPLASGGFATVYLAMQKGLDRTVAVKLLHERVLERATERERFVNEARVTAGLAHPNIIKVLDFGAGAGVPWIVYEYLPGSSLAELLAEGELGIPAVLEACAQVAGALADAHQHGILHRDVKPGNVMCAEPGFYKIGDFGLARWIEGGTALTATGVVVGTPAFFAPELITGAEPTPATDLYALGVTLFQLLTGQLPPLGAGAGDAFTRAWNVRVQADQVPPSLARRVAQVAGDLLALDPSRRTASAAEARRQLEELAAAAAQALDGVTASASPTVDSPVAPPTPQAGRARASGVRPGSASGRVPLSPTPHAGFPVRRSRAGLALAAAALVAGALALSRRQPAPPPPPPPATPAPVVSATAPRVPEIDDTVESLSRDLASVERRTIIALRPGIVGENTRYLANRSVIEPEILRLLANAHRLVRTLRELKLAAPITERALRTVARVLAQSTVLQLERRDPGVQRRCAQIRGEAQAFGREMPGSGFALAGAHWVEAKYVGLAGRGGDADALRHLRAAGELLRAEPDPAWQRSADYATAVLMAELDARQHQRRLNRIGHISEASNRELRDSAVRALEGIGLCLDRKAREILFEWYGVSLVREIGGELSNDPETSPAQRAVACALARRILAEMPRPPAGHPAATSWDELRLLSCPPDKSARSGPR